MSVDLKKRRGLVNRRLAKVLGIIFYDRWQSSVVYPHIRKDMGVLKYYHDDDERYIEQDWYWDWGEGWVLQYMLLSPQFIKDNEISRYWALSKTGFDEWNVFEMRMGITPFEFITISVGTTPNEAVVRAIIPELREGDTQGEGRCPQ